MSDLILAEPVDPEEDRHLVWIEYERPEGEESDSEAVNWYESQSFSFDTEDEAVAFMRRLRVMAEDLRFEMDDG